MIGYQELEWVLEPSGVYLLLREGKVIYAGKSTNLLGRLEIHRQWMKRFCAGRPTVYHDYAVAEFPPIFDKVWFKLVPPAEMDKELAIARKQFNIQPFTAAEMNRARNKEPLPKVNVMDVPEIKELLSA